LSKRKASSAPVGERAKKIISIETVARYENGDKYEGGFDNGFPRGNGVMTYAND
jgi:hypothetical protein